MKIGCHVSIAGGVQNAPANAAKLGGEVFQMFTRSPRGGPALKLSDEVVDQFFLEVKKYKFSEYVVHTPYYINFGSKNNRIFYGSVSVVREELERASLLGAAYVMTHLGSYKDLGREKGFAQLIKGLNKVLDGYKGSARLLVEISAGAGELMGGTFEEIKKIIVHPKFKSRRIGVCFDTAHAFASGYDLREAPAVKKTFAAFDKIVGLKNLKVIHANDSKIDLGGKRDRHDHIGAGKIGRAGFGAILHHAQLAGVNMYLETEHDLVEQDIKILKNLRFTR
ncbi:MAG: deoxyribonuclease IV [Candidatus Doudnabacteria bacterium]|nr:deoxyribonuclease IV [Candidatus Doudnabacteria bacterium]